MNERIRELAEQSEITQYVAAHNKYLERFAELIVKECVMIGCRAFHNDHGIVQSFPTDQIKEHFGVK